MPNNNSVRRLQLYSSFNLQYSIFEISCAFVLADNFRMTCALYLLFITGHLTFDLLKHSTAHLHMKLTLVFRLYFYAHVLRLWAKKPPRV